MKQRGADRRQQRGGFLGDVRKAFQPRMHRAVAVDQRARREDEFEAGVGINRIVDRCRRFGCAIGEKFLRKRPVPGERF